MGFAMMLLFIRPLRRAILLNIADVTTIRHDRAMAPSALLESRWYRHHQDNFRPLAFFRS
jgi:hypothetical protein